MSDDEMDLVQALALVGVTPDPELNGAAPKDLLQSIVQKHDLRQGQKAALALWLLPEIEGGVEQTGRPGVPTSKLGSRYPVHSDESTAAAEVMDIGMSAMYTVIRIQKRKPEIIEDLLRGNLNISQAARACGLARGFHTMKGLRSEEIGVDAGGRTKVIQYGRGDKWKEAMSPLMRYLMAWERRGFKFPHLNPKEARARLKVIEELQVKLEKMREDLEPRSHSARLTVAHHQPGRK